MDVIIIFFFNECALIILDKKTLTSPPPRNNISENRAKKHHWQAFSWHNFLNCFCKAHYSKMVNFVALLSGFVVSCAISALFPSHFVQIGFWANRQCLSMFLEAAAFLRDLYLNLIRIYSSSGSPYECLHWLPFSPLMKMCAFVYQILLKEWSACQMSEIWQGNYYYFLLL